MIVRCGEKLGICETSVCHGAVRRGKNAKGGNQRRTHASDAELGSAVPLAQQGDEGAFAAIMARPRTFRPVAMV
ncbi:hypothetical protein E4P36_27445 [Streptomyces sp. 4R-3d]|nr:hypothetical protein E4P36_27445 [Streptomyces sp. 4R-3d]